MKERIRVFLLFIALGSLFVIPGSALMFILYYYGGSLTPWLHTLYWAIGAILGVILCGLIQLIFNI